MLPNIWRKMCQCISDETHILSDFDDHVDKTTIMENDTISCTFMVNYSNHHILNDNEMYEDFKNDQIKNILENNIEKDQSILITDNIQNKNNSIISYSWIKNKNASHKKLMDFKSNKIVSFGSSV